MYQIVYRSWYDAKDGVVHMKDIDTLEKARSLRQVSGDLVTDVKGNIVTSDKWLWEWEKENLDSYAQQAIGYQKRLNQAAP